MTWSPGSNADNGSAAKVLWQASRLDSGEKLEGLRKNNVKYIVLHFSLILWDCSTCEHGNLCRYGAKCLQHRLQKKCTWAILSACLAFHFLCDSFFGKIAKNKYFEAATICALAPDTSLWLKSWVGCWSSLNFKDKWQACKHIHWPPQATQSLLIEYWRIMI